MTASLKTSPRPSLATAQYSARSLADMSTITYSATHHIPFLKTFHKSSTEFPTFMLALSIFHEIPRAYFHSSDLNIDKGITDPRVECFWPNQLLKWPRVVNLGQDNKPQGWSKAFVWLKNLPSSWQEIVPSCQKHRHKHQHCQEL